MPTFPWPVLCSSVFYKYWSVHPLVNTNWTLLYGRAKSQVAPWGWGTLPPVHWLWLDSPDGTTTLPSPLRHVQVAMAGPGMWLGSIRGSKGLYTCFYQQLTWNDTKSIKNRAVIFAAWSLLNCILLLKRLVLSGLDVIVTVTASACMDWVKWCNQSVCSPQLDSRLINPIGVSAFLHSCGLHESDGVLTVWIQLTLSTNRSGVRCVFWDCWMLTLSLKLPDAHKESEMKPQCPLPSHSAHLLATVPTA